MSEKIYRGKCTEENYYSEWVTGYYVPLKDSYKERYSYRIYTGYAESDPEGFYPDYCEVDPETVGQCIEITDKNGKWIFEDDVIKSNDYTFVVRFGKCGGVANNPNYGYIGFYLEGADVKTKEQMEFGMRDDIMYFINDAEVVGNIHDNPELIEEWKDE